MNGKSFLAAALALACLVTPALSQIEAGQAVDIRIKGIPHADKIGLDGKYPLIENGKVNLPYIGGIQAVGIEPDDLAKLIENAYREAKIYLEPKVRVTTHQGNRVKDDAVVHVRGHVHEEGSRPYEKGLTVFQAVQAAGGATESAANRRVILWRDGGQQRIDLTTSEGKGVVVHPYDTIAVHRKIIYGN